MRTIRFRGKRLGDGTWCFGDLLSGICDDLHIQNIKDGNSGYRGPIEVDKETVGQFTGLPDITGKDVYESDLWERNGFIGVIMFRFSEWQIQYTPSSDSIQYPSFYSNIGTGKVIGNIYDNPELLLDSTAPEISQKNP